MTTEMRTDYDCEATGMPAERWGEAVFTVGEQEIAIEVSAPAGENQPPVAQATGVPLTGTAPLVVDFDASGSSDPDGDPLAFAWAFTFRPEGSAATLSDPTAVNPTFLIDEPGTYILQLIVNDGTLDSDPDSVTIMTLNSPPVADAGPAEQPCREDARCQQQEPQGLPAEVPLVKDLREAESKQDQNGQRRFN